jgi:hypothetical protein
VQGRDRRLFQRPRLRPAVPRHARLIHGIPGAARLLSERCRSPHLDLYELLTQRNRGPSSLNVVCWALGIDSPRKSWTVDGGTGRNGERRRSRSRPSTTRHDVRCNECHLSPGYATSCLRYPRRLGRGEGIGIPKPCRRPWKPTREGAP